MTKMSDAEVAFHQIILAHLLIGALVSFIIGVLLRKRMSKRLTVAYFCLGVGGFLAAAFNMIINGLSTGGFLD